MNFKDFQFSIGKLKADVHSQIAKNNPLHRQDTKALSLWIYQERTDLASMRTMAYERSETIKALKAWIKEEEEENEDLQDIVGDKLCRLFEKQIEIEQHFADQYQQYRHAVKSIREREEKLSEKREKRRSLQSRIFKASNNSPKLSEELKQLEKETQESEMDLADFKRFALKEAFYLRLNAMSEYAEKTALIAGFGRYLADLIDIEPTETPKRRPYEKATEATTILNDAIQAVEQWNPKDERPTLLLADQDKKGKSVETTTNTPPELPPRPPHVLQEEHTSPVLPPRPTTQQTTRKSIDRIELYDPPPPAYQEDTSSTRSYTTVYHYQQQQPSYSSTHSPILLPESPGPIYIQQQIIHPLPTVMYSQMNYSQLYRQVSQRQQYYYHRPYSEFQQKSLNTTTEPSAPSSTALLF